MAENILAYKLRTRFSPDMQLLQNHRAIYGASLKAQKVMLPLLKCQAVCYWSKFVLFTQLSTQLIKFSKIWLCHFLVYMAKYLMQKILSRSWEKCVTDRQTDRWTDKQVWFYRTPSTKIKVYVFQKFENKIFNYLVLTVSHMERINTKKKKYNQHSSVFKQ